MTPKRPAKGRREVVVVGWTVGTSGPVGPAGRCRATGPATVPDSWSFGGHYAWVFSTRADAAAWIRSRLATPYGSRRSYYKIRRVVRPKGEMGA